MGHLRAVQVIVIALFFAVAAPRLSASQPIVVDLPDASFQMTVPDAWKVQTHVIADILDVRVAPRDKGDFLIRMTVFPLRDKTMATPEGLKASIGKRGETMLSGAVQDKIVIIEVKTEKGVGYLFHLTDRNEEKGPGDYREATQGAVALGTRLAVVTILTHTGDDATVTQALAALKTMRLSAPSSPQSQ
jgi:hypothetical protein